MDAGFLKTWEIQRYHLFIDIVLKVSLDKVSKRVFFVLFKVSLRYLPEKEFDVYVNIKCVNIKLLVVCRVEIVNSGQEHTHLPSIP